MYFSKVKDFVYNRDPIKMIESWIMDDFVNIKKTKNYWELHKSYIISMIR